MSMETFLKIREMGKEIKRKRQNEEINFEYMTAPCRRVSETMSQIRD